MRIINTENKIETFIFNEKLFEEKEKKIDFEFQQLGIEMQEHFGKQDRSKIWPLFYKKQYTIPMIRDSWTAYKKSTVQNFRYFMGILNNKAGIKKK